MSLPGDRLSIPTPHGVAQIERTQQGVRVNVPQGDLSMGNARQLSQALYSMTNTGGMSPQQIQGSQQQGGQQQGGFQGGGQQGGWQGPQRSY